METTVAPTVQDKMRRANGAAAGPLEDMTGLYSAGRTKNKLVVQRRGIP